MDSSTAEPTCETRCESTGPKRKLYRHYDRDGVLLYVGVSVSALARLESHFGKSHWANQIVRVEIEWFDTPALAIVAEGLAITTERPLHNKIISNGLGGRPLDSERDKTLTAIKPWIAAGLSRATWYRRRAERAKQ